MITKVAVTQMSCGWDVGKNIEKAECLLREAASKGAGIVLLQELFMNRYFCQDQNPDFFRFAEEIDGNENIRRFSELARELSIVIPLSFYERRNNALYNSVLMIDADGTNLGVYRKTHIPHDCGYWEKFYFTPGDTGFKVWRTAYGSVGVGICWDQWFPEAARAMALQGADILMYPTAYGSQPGYDEDTVSVWQRVMQGHSAANAIPVCASNRIGREEGESTSIMFYGSSFITDGTGGIRAEASKNEESVVTASFNFDELRRERDDWCFFRDRRPVMYDVLLSKDGKEIYKRSI